MRHRLMLLGALALGLFVTPAGATVREDPVALKLVGASPVARPGQPLRITLELSSPRGAEIENLTIEGEGWTGRPISSRAPRVIMAPGQSERIEFEATPADASRPLVVRYESNGRSYRRTFDFSPATDQLGRGGRGTQALAAPPGPPRATAAAMERRAEPRGLDFDGPIGAAVPRLEAQAPALPSAGRVIRVTGTFVYKRDDRILDTDPYYWMGADGLTVEVWDRVYGPTGRDMKLGQGMTDASGDFDFYIYWDGVAEADPDLVVLFVASNSKFTLTPDSYPVPYFWMNGPRWNFTGTQLDLGTLTSANEADFPALNVFTDMMRNWRWFYIHRDLDLPPLQLFYPCTHDNASHFSADEQSIAITEPAAWMEETHAHEYGHHVNYSSLNYVSVFYCNFPIVCDPDPPTDCSHCVWCPENATTAWNEGFSDFLGWLLPSSYEADYGLAALHRGDFEDIRACWQIDFAYYSDPFVDEGHAAAVMTDIADAANEQDYKRLANGEDALALGGEAVLDAIFTSLPTTLHDFIYAFLAHHLDRKEELWRTLANNRIDLDASAPPAPGSLHSTSHTAGVQSPDATPTFTWTRPDDDFSGVIGYSIRIGATAAAPDEIQDIGNVTTYTSEPLAPGTYWVTLRAMDRAGHWGPYATWGTLVIREALPANLLPYTFPGWADALVPRATGDAKFQLVTAPTEPLPSGTASTYWNGCGRNDGESSTGAGWMMRVVLDGAVADTSASGTTAAGGSAARLNQGPLTVPAGRHTLGMRLDDDEAIAETVENDNAYGRQWIWAPYTITSSATRAAPPDRTGGWEDIPLPTPRYYNVDGLRVTNASGSVYWRALYIRANDNAVDYDCRIHVPTASPDTGFAAYRAYSSRPAGCTDAVVYEWLNTSAVPSWDVGVVNASGGSADYYARLLAATDIAAGDSLTMSFSTNEMMRLREAEILSADVGWYSLTLRIVSGTGPFHLAWFDSDLQAVALLDATATATATDTQHPARIDIEVTRNGHYGIALYRDFKDGGDPATVVLEFDHTPPDYEPHATTGWYKAFVPRPANDGTCGGVPMPDTLYGDIASTYLNFGVWNDSPGDQPSSPYVRMYLDGVQKWGSFIAAPDPYATTCYNGVVARTVPGGRHTLSLLVDSDEEIEERDEANNKWGKQWVWGPALLTPAAPVTRAAPPDPTGAWEEIADAPYGIWYDCDGLRARAMTSPPTGDWGACAVMPGDTSDVDVRLHEVASGTLTGFRSSLVRSTWGPGQSDYCLVNFHRTPPRDLDMGLLRAGDGTQPYTAQVATSLPCVVAPDGIYGPYTLAPGTIVQLHEFQLGPGNWQVTLADPRGSLDWGLSVHDGGLAYHTKNSAMDGGISWEGGFGEGESVLITADSAGYYVVAAWKNTAADLPIGGTYTLEVRPSLVDVPGDTPARTALAGAWPNPFRSGTRVVFDLARETDVSLDVYDLHGARVATLASGRLAAGRHGVEWRAGGPPGIYFVRLAADGVVASRRLVKLD